MTTNLSAPSDLTANQDLLRFGVIPVAVPLHAASADHLADALVAGGLPIVEVTLRTKAGLPTIERLAGRRDILVGAGTVINAEQAEQAIRMGARFVVSPGCDPLVLSVCEVAGVPVIPGVCTPTDLMVAVRAGRTVVKFFPAEAAGGTRMISALSAPFPQVRFIATGGIEASALPGYLSHPAVVAVGGSWMVAHDLLARQDWAEVTRRCADAVTVAAACRS